MHTTFITILSPGLRTGIIGLFHYLCSCQSNIMDIVNKLKVKTDRKLWLIAAPNSLEIATAGLELQTSLSGKTAIEQVLVFAKNKKELEDRIGKLIPRLAPEVLIWIAYPKKSGTIASDITRDSGWDIINAAGYEPVAQVAIDADWSALRFRKREEIKGFIREIPMEERNVSGVDFKTRTVTPAADMMAAMKKYKGMQAFFDNMAFSHKKEHVIAIEDAKKPETRQRRIEKMIEMLLINMQQKAKK